MIATGQTETAFSSSRHAHVTHCERCGVERTDWERDRQTFPLCWHCDQEFSAECYEDAAQDAEIERAMGAKYVAQLAQSDTDSRARESAGGGGE